MSVHAVSPPLRSKLFPRSSPHPNECMHERSKSAPMHIHKSQRFRNKADGLYLTTPVTLLRIGVEKSLPINLRSPIHRLIKERNSRSKTQMTSTTHIVSANKIQCQLSKIAVYEKFCITSERSKTNNCGYQQFYQ